MPSAIRTLCLAVSLSWSLATAGQTQKALTNSDIVAMTKQGFATSLIIKTIQSSSSDFDVSAAALIDLKNAGVDSSVMEAMLAAQAMKPSAAAEAAHGTMPPPNGAPNGTAQAPCSSAGGCLLRDSTLVSLKFANQVTSKTAHEGDPVEFLLDEDLKVGDAIVVAKGAHAVAAVSSAKKAGMIGRPGELSVQLQYLVAGNNHVRLRGTKGREGEGKVGTTVALTVIFGPIGLIKHGKNVEIPAGTPLTAYVDQDTWLSKVK